MPAAPRVFAWLAAEALSDALRRRIVPAIAALAVLSLFFVDGCTSCTPTVTQDGEAIARPQIAGTGGLLMMVLVGLWTAVLAGVLAADHLATGEDRIEALQNVCWAVINTNEFVFLH